MKSLIKRISLLTLVMVMVMSVLVIPASASTTGENSGVNIWAFYDGSFSASWELYHSGDSGRASLTYGYNTFLVHEDYAWASHSTKDHYAAIVTANGTYTGAAKSAGSTSKIEITHLAYEVEYFNIFG